MTTLSALPSTAPVPVHRNPEFLHPGSLYRLGQITHRLLQEAETLDANSPISVLARWRAAALVVIQSLCRPEDPAWQILRPEAPWTMPSTVDGDAREEMFAEGWAITCGVLEGLLHTLPLPEQDRPEPAEPPVPVEREQAIDWATLPFPQPSAGIYLLLLGSPQVHGARGRVETQRLSRLTEYAIWLHLNPGTDRHAMDAALWPDQVTRADSRNTAMSRLRAWLGVAHFPKWTQESGYVLAPSVTSDWSQFRALAALGESDGSSTGTRCLRAALQLVEGPPFTDAIRPDWYGWAAPYVREMTEAIVSAARELAHRYLKDGDLPGSRWAVKRGYRALPGGLQQFKSAAEGITNAHSEPDGLRQLADQMTYTPVTNPPAHKQTLLG
jgi:hypothetical protein